jgi:hypothetical protein
MQEPTTNNSQGALYSKAQPDVPHEHGEDSGEVKEQPHQSPKPEVKPANDKPIKFPVGEVGPT